MRKASFIKNVLHLADGVFGRCSFPVAQKKAMTTLLRKESLLKRRTKYKLSYVVNCARRQTDRIHENFTKHCEDVLNFCQEGKDDIAAHQAGCIIDRCAVRRVIYDLMELRDIVYNARTEFNKAYVVLGPSYTECSVRSLYVQLLNATLIKTSRIARMLKDEAFCLVTSPSVLINILLSKHLHYRTLIRSFEL